MTDRSLLKNFVEHRDQPSFAELVTRHGAMVYTTARRLAGEDADDIAQAVFLLLSQKAGALSEHQNLAGWLYETTRRCAANALRQKRRRIAKIQAAQEAAMSSSTIQAHNTPLLEQLDQGLSQLSKTQKQVLLMRYMENRSVEETALQLGLTPAAVMKRSTRGLAWLREYFHRQGTATTLQGAIACMVSQAIQLPQAQQAQLASVGAGQAAANAINLAAYTRWSMKLAAAKSLALVAMLILVPWVVAVKFSRGIPPLPATPAVPTTLPALQPVELNDPRTVAERFLTELRNADVEQVARYLVPSDSAKNRKIAGDYVDKFRNSIYARFPKRLALFDSILPAGNQKTDGGEFTAMHPTDADVGNLDINVIRSGGHWYVVAAYYADPNFVFMPPLPAEDPQNKREPRPTSVDPDLNISGHNGAIAIPGPLKFPEWLRSTPQFKQWQIDRKPTIFNTTDDAGNIYHLVTQGYTVSGWFPISRPPKAAILGSTEMYRPDKTFAESTVWDREGHLSHWSIADATGKHYIWKVNRQRDNTFSIDNITHFDADGNQTQYTADENGHISREATANPIGESSRVIFDASGDN